VEDTGKGILPEDLPHIFDRFHIPRNPKRKEDDSMGIGLSLTKNLVEVLGGTISVRSKYDSGSLFRVNIPVTKEAYPDPVMLNPGYVENSSKEKEGKQDVLSEESESTSEGSRILVVEDSPDLRDYICRQLKGSHTLFCAGNGKEGLERSLELIPDLVVSDLMMPEMNGLDLCKALKEDPRTSHIPVIILTAKSDKKSRLEGLETGADAYLVKPFDAEELRIRIRNLILQRRKLQEIYSVWISSDLTQRSVVNHQDNLIKQLFAIIEERFSDPGFNIEHLGEELHMSRSQLFRKVSAITGTTPNKILKLYRLKKAAELIRSDGENITQIMYEVGYRNPSHFARSFRELFGVNPSDYQKAEERIGTSRS
jgi:DNA-binding response OmpR family regulator